MLYFLYPLSAVVENLFRNHLHRKKNEKGNNNKVVDMADEGNKIRNNVKRQKQITDRKPEKKPGCSRCPPVFEHKLIDADLLL